MPKTWKDNFDLFEINPDRLDEEWLRHSRLYYEHACELAEAREVHERAKSAREVAAAETAMDVRKRPEHYGFDGPKGPTVDGVQQAVLLHPSYRKADSDLINARHALDLAQAVVDALEHRKKALENMVSLRLANYYSEPRTPRGAEGITAARSFGSRKSR